MVVVRSRVWDIAVVLASLHMQKCCGFTSPSSSTASVRHTTLLNVAESSITKKTIFDQEVEDLFAKFDADGNVSSSELTLLYDFIIACINGMYKSMIYADDVS